MKKLKIILSVLLVLLTFNTFKVDVADASNITIYVDGEAQSYSNQAIFENGNTLVPLRGIFEELGATVTWEQSTQSITAKKGDITVWLQLGSTQTKVNDVAKTIAVPAKAINGTTLVPLRFISEALGATVEWHGETQSITILSGPYVYDVVLEFPADQYPQTAAHIKSAIENGETPICTIDRDGADENRNESLAGIPTKDGYDRDEFPMAMCEEGGEGASVMYVDPSDNRGAGSWVGNQLEQYPDGTRVLFKVVGTITTKPTPVEPTPQPQPTPVEPKPTPQPEVKSYKNCTELRKDYPKGVDSSHPAYDKKHDRDGDGYACEIK